MPDLRLNNREWVIKKKIRSRKMNDAGGEMCPSLLASVRKKVECAGGRRDDQVGSDSTNDNAHYPVMEKRCRNPTLSRSGDQPVEPVEGLENTAFFCCWEGVRNSCVGSVQGSVCFFCSWSFSGFSSTNIARSNVSLRKSQFTYVAAFPARH